MIMKPKTRIQKEVARLSANLRPISATQIDWAYRHCVEHIGYRTKKGNITCSDCGHEWHGNSGLCDSLDGCTCPQCRTELKVWDTRKRTHKETQYFSVITTCKGYQLIRVAQVRCESRKGEPMKFYCHEVVQRWISPKGIITDMALLRGFSFCYCDVWALDSDMEVRPHNSLYDDVVAWGNVYPNMKILPQLRRNGFKGDFHGITPVRLFKALLSDPRIETLMKGGEIEGMKYFLANPPIADECWASYLIAKRHKYQIGNLSMWCDYLRMLKNSVKTSATRRTSVPKTSWRHTTRQPERLKPYTRRNGLSDSAGGRLKGVSVSSSDNSNERKMQRISSPTNPNSSDW